MRRKGPSRDIERNVQTATEYAYGGAALSNLSYARTLCVVIPLVPDFWC
jgi:hypothetical protein